MNLKRGKYNLIFVLMVLLIFGVCGYEVFMTYVPVNNNQQADHGNADDGNDDVPPEQTDPQPGDEQQQLPPVENDDFLAKNKRFALKIVNHALDKLYDGAGYKSTYSKTMINDAGIMAVTQNINGTINKSGNKSLEKLTFECDSPMGVSQIRAFYFDGAQVTQYQTNKGKTAESDFASATVTSMTAAEYYNKYVLNLAQKPVFKFSSARIISSGSKDGKAYTVIQAEVDATSMNSGYTKYYESTGDLTGATAKSATYKFYIYDDTTQIYQISATENLVGKNPAFGIDVKITINLKQNFTVYSQEFDIEKP